MAYNVAAVMGKRLWHGKQLTEEYKSRIDALISNLTSLDPQLIVFTGGKREETDLYTEAGLGKEYFTGRVLSRFENISLVDKEAKSSVQNIRNILAYLEKLDIRPEDVALTLISSDYHIDRLKKVDERTPIQSLIMPIREMGLQIPMYMRAPYPYRNSQDEAQKWIADLYLKSDDLTVIRVNIEGVVDGKVRNIVEANADDFHSDLLQISRYLERIPDDARTKDASAVVHHALTLLSPWDLYLRDLAVKGNLSEDDKKVLEKTYDTFVRGIRMIKNIDPDEPVDSFSN